MKDILHNPPSLRRIELQISRQPSRLHDDADEVAVSLDEGVQDLTGIFGPDVPDAYSWAKTSEIP